MRKIEEIDERIKYYEKQHHIIYEKELNEVMNGAHEFSQEFKIEENKLLEKITLLQWVKGIDIFRNETF
jgi:hypothetical protein